MLNRLVLIAEQRAFDIQQIDYKDRFTVFNTIYREQNFRADKISEFVVALRDTTVHLSDRLRLLCEIEDFTEEEKKLIAQQASESFDKYYNLLGPVRCKALGYNLTNIRKEIETKIALANISLLDEFKSVFVPGSKMSNVDAKSEIRKIYQKYGIDKTPKTTDLEEYFEIKKVKITDPLLKARVHGIEILGIK